MIDSSTTLFAVHQVASLLIATFYYFIRGICIVNTLKLVILYAITVFPTQALQQLT